MMVRTFKSQFIKRVTGASAHLFYTFYQDIKQTKCQPFTRQKRWNFNQFHRLICMKICVGTKCRTFC